MHGAKKWVALAAIVLLVIVVLQNTAEVETKILFISVSMPRAVLLFVTALLGFVLGVLFQKRGAKKAA